MAERFGRYLVERSLASGGMAEVCLARQLGPNGFDRPCVLKRMHRSLAALPEVVELFLHEARLTAQLNHPNIAQVFDFGSVEGTFFLVMERVEGPSLRAVISAFAQRSERVPVPVACKVIAELATALDYAHRALGGDGLPLNVVHRDVTPSNVLLSNTGVTKLIDFGIAKTAASAVRTTAGTLRGSLSYMSPEQLLGDPLDGRSDVFALALVAFELLTCTPALPAVATQAECYQAALTIGARSLHSLRPEVSPALAAVFARALAADVNARSTAGEFAAALNATIDTNGWQVGQSVAWLAQRATPTDDCPPESLLEQLARGAAPEAQRASLRSHLDGCETCRKIVAFSTELAPTPAHPDRIGRYEVQHELGAGAMGVVLKGFDPQLNRPVALKLLLSRDRSSEARERMLREGQAAARVRHPNVVTVYDVGLQGDELFVAMEFVEGQTLRAFASMSPPRPALLQVLHEVACGLEAIHQAGLVHRDIKPDNVLVDSTGHARVADFGLVREETSAMTRPGVLVGTPAYMAPEQLAGLPVTAASDQFSFCVVACECLLGRRPFDDSAARALNLAALRALPPRLRSVLRRGLATTPAARFESMTALLSAWQRALAPRRWPFAAALAVATSVLVAAFAASSNSSRPTPSPVVAPAAPKLSNPPAPTPTAPAPEPVAEPQAPAPTKPSLATGLLHLASTPVAAITVDGHPRGTTPSQLRVAAGRHEVALRLTDGRASHVFSVQIDANADKKIDWAPQKQTLKLRGVPPEIEFHVALDGQPLGVTPLADVAAYEGPHRVAVSTEAGWKAAQTFTVHPGKNVRLKFVDGSRIEVAEEAR